MATVAESTDRRRCERHPSASTGWQANAVVRPGQDVVMVNIGRHGALVESTCRLRPGHRTELQLSGHNLKSSVRGRIDRSEVAALDPIRYRTAIVFEDAVEILPRSGDSNKG